MSVPPNPDRDPEQTICFCHNVSYSKLCEAIAAGADNIAAIQAATCASTGCGGCQWEVEEVLAEELAELQAEAASKSK